MRVLPPLAIAVVLILMPAVSMAAAIVDKVQIKGLNEDDDTQRAMAENIRVALTLNDALGTRLGEARLEYLMEQTKDEAAGALEPFGYYSPTIEVTSERLSAADAARIEKEKKGGKDKAKDKDDQDDDDTGDNASAPAGDVQRDSSDADGKVTTSTAPANAAGGEGAVAQQATDGTSSGTASATPRQRAPADHMSVTITVTPGEPVRVRDADIRIDGEGGSDRYLAQDLKDFAPAKGAAFDHQTYEASKLKIVRRLAERGYLDADFETRKVEVTRAQHAADIDLSWVSGIRYDMGPTHFNQSYFRPGLLDRLVYWDEGSYYHQGKLDRLRQSLVALDYFSNIDIQPDVDNAVDGRVPIEVNLKLAPRTIYQYGLSYGTEYGAGFLAGVERRYVNSRGHKLKTLLDYAQNRKALTTTYRIPAFKWLDGWYAATAQLYDEQTDYIDTRRIELIGSRSGQLNENWTITASIHALRERWLFQLADDDSDGAEAVAPYRYATYVYPQLEAKYVNVDDRLFPRSGITATATLRGGLEGAGSDTNFGQLLIGGRWYKGFGLNDRLIVRGEVGQTSVASQDALPPSLRFYAGGDNSIRGYQYREVGPRVRTDGGEYSVGGNKLITGSVEYEHYYKGGPFGGAVFVDSGTAYNDSPDFKTGVGFGVRYKSPIGPVRVDIAHGLNDPDSVVQLYLSIGASL
ncbi:autotransporter secretion outer membrane protein TamA [Pseudoxanthomonas sp. GM95]|uniref:autotransporter assembly complex protein TamA n=1 Tax=Pseudoxanthomonas sp. GM95 TaxID=1881043 RepID=UPI0008B866DC|nr:outer membrane protein assembly factor [Pseudoxanthomonas sp. GM95]SEM43378.1 autotransporter secretion outer membrane protein TamA [Pseudoxanthomonas sp. GM95]